MATVSTEFLSCHQIKSEEVSTNSTVYSWHYWGYMSLEVKCWQGLLFLSYFIIIAIQQLGTLWRNFYLMSFHMGQMMGQLELNVLAEDQIMTAPQWISVNISYKGRRA